MNYKKLIEDCNNGTFDKKNVTVVMDNDGGYFDVNDESLDDDERGAMTEELEKTYGGSPDGYRDIVDVLRAAGVPSEWC